eukprot:256929-Chlamydomonas_euryale.AAC.1
MHVSTPRHTRPPEPFTTTQATAGGDCGCAAAAPAVHCRSSSLTRLTMAVLRALSARGLRYVWQGRGVCMADLVQRNGLSKHLLVCV